MKRNMSRMSEHPAEALRVFYALWEASEGAVGYPARDHYALRLRCGHPVPPCDVEPDMRYEMPTHIYCKVCGDGPEPSLKEGNAALAAFTLPRGYVAFDLFEPLEDSLDRIPDFPPRT